MSSSEWESLCDGCGKCCVLKLEDIDTEEIYYTDVGCELLDCKTCRCLNYADRKKLVPDCVVLTADGLDALHWMPKSCAYRLVNEGLSLPDWHPLVTGIANSTRLSGNSRHTPDFQSSPLAMRTLQGSATTRWSRISTKVASV